VPRKASGEKLAKVVSTKIGLADFIVLEKYARIRYNENKLEQPTISHLLRKIIKSWAYELRKTEAERKSHANPTQPTFERTLS